MNGSWLRIIQKPNTIFLWGLKKQKNAHFKKKKVIISWIFQYFDILIGIFAIQYFTVMNQSGRSILAIRNHKSIKFGFSAFTLEQLSISKTKTMQRKN